ncbi:fibronectin-like [Glandiceps talaboti]
MQEITGLSPDTSYTITLYAVSGSGDDQEMSSVVTLSETTDNVGPGVIVVKNYDTTSILMTWGAAYSGTVFDGYLVRIDPEDDNLAWKTPSDDRIVEFDGLTPGKEYTLHVRLQGANIEESETQRTVPLPATSLNVTALDSTSVCVSWDAPAGVVMYYLLSSSPVNGSESFLDILDSDKTSYTLTGLTPGTSVVVYVYSTVDGNNGTVLLSSSVSDSATTDEVESDVVVIKSVTMDTIDVIWNTDLAEESTTFFLIQLSPADGLSYPQVVTKTADSYAEFSFTGLTSGRLYSVSITAGSNVISEDVYTVPSPATSLTSSTQTSTSVTLGWTSPAGDADGFYVYVDDTLAGTIADTEVSYVVENLEPKTSYTFEVVTFVGSGDSERVSNPVSHTESTLAVPADTIVVISATSDTIEVMWAEVTDPAISGYLVTLDPVHT